MIIYPLVNIQKAIENGLVEIVDLAINSIVIFHSYVNVYQRVANHWSLLQHSTIQTQRKLTLRTRSCVSFEATMIRTRRLFQIRKG